MQQHEMRRAPCLQQHGKDSQFVTGKLESGLAPRLRTAVTSTGVPDSALRHETHMENAKRSLS